MKHLFSLLILGSVAATTAIQGGTAQGGFDIQGTSDAYALSANLTFTTILSTNVSAVVSPVADSSGTAPAVYNTTMHIVTFSTTAGAYALNTAHVLTASTGVIDTQADSTVDGLPGVRLAHGTGTINNLNLNTLSSLTGGLLGTTADTIVSTSTTTGGYGALSSSGSTVVTNLHFSILGIDQGAINGSISPNTAATLNLAGLVGVSVILNEQIKTGDGIFDSAITTNAIHIHFNATVVAGLGTLNGDIIVGHSQSEIKAVPEPSSMALVGVGFAGLLFKARRRMQAEVV